MKAEKIDSLQLSDLEEDNDEIESLDDLVEGVRRSRRAKVLSEKLKERM